MEIILNSQILDKDGNALGPVTNLVVSQSSRQETHLIFYCKKDNAEHLVPLEHVLEATPDGVKLKLGPQEIERLPFYMPEEYKEIDLFEVDPELRAYKGKVLTFLPAAERNIGRRKFMVMASGAIVAIIAAAMTFPMVKFLIYPMYQGFVNIWVKIGNLTSLAAENTPQLLKFVKVSKQAYMTDTVEKSLWVIKGTKEFLEMIYSDENNRVFKSEGKIFWENKIENQLVVYSGKCPHLGCPYRWDEPSKTFRCPCHNSVFKLNGEVVSGPAPRRLDVLPVKTEGDEIEVIDAEYRAGIKSKERIA